MNMENRFEKLDAQSEVSSFAQFTPEEHSEFQTYLDARDSAPDAHLDAAYEERTELNEEPYDGGGWPGDGSGTDDLADLMAHGDEGCYDEPQDEYDF